MKVPPTREFRQVLAQLELISHGTCQSWDRGTPPSDPDRSPRGESHPPHEQFLRDWLNADSDNERQAIHGKATEALREARVKPMRKIKAETPRERDKDILKTGEGWEPAEVARAFRLTIREVIDLRTHNGLDPSTGKAWQQQESQPDRARRLRATGASTREVAVAMGVHQTQVVRWTKDNERKAA